MSRAACSSACRRSRASCPPPSPPSFPMDPDLRGRSAAVRCDFMVEGETRDRNAVAAVRHVRVGDSGLLQNARHSAGRRPRRSRIPTARTAPPVVILNRSLARQPLATTRIRSASASQFDNGDTWSQIVGVVGDVKEFGPERDAPYELYLPMEQSPRPGRDPGARRSAIRRASPACCAAPCLDVDPQTAITSFETLEQARANALQSPRTASRLFATFAGLAFLIAVAGITQHAGALGPAAEARDRDPHGAGRQSAVDRRETCCGRACCWWASGSWRGWRARCN